jgi:hypothetical protein
LHRREFVGVGGGEGNGGRGSGGGRDLLAWRCPIGMAPAKQGLGFRVQCLGVAPANRDARERESEREC